MNRVEFISELRSKLKRLPKDEIEDALNYYNEYFDEAGIEDEQQVMESLGSPCDIASQILADYSLKDMSLKPNSTKKGISAVWFAILAVFAAPIALPLTIAIFLTVGAIGVAVIAIIIAFLLTMIAMGGAGIVAVISGLVVIFKDIPTALIFIGGGIVVVGIDALIFIPITYLANKGFRFIANTTNKILNKAKKRRGVKGNYE